MSDVQWVPDDDWDRARMAGISPIVDEQPAADEPAEPDGEEERVDLEVNLEFPKRRVALGYGEQHVEVEGPDALVDLAELAERLWKLTTPPASVRRALGAGSALVTELSGD